MVSLPKLKFMIVNLASNKGTDRPKEKDEKGIGIKLVLNKLINNWHLFAISILCCLCFAALCCFANCKTILNITDTVQPQQPNNATIYIFSLFLGLTIPAIYLLVKELFYIHTISSKSDIQDITSIQIIGEINHCAADKTVMVSKVSHPVIYEQFEAICTNLQFSLSNKKSNVLLFTSSMSGEGKSFLCLNLGHTLALSGKKVIFLDLDLRKPKLSENIGIDNSIGYTNYAVSDTVAINNIIKPLSFHKNCFIISSGIIPSDPAEILNSAKLEKLIINLKKQFDYILIDCAPIGLVADAMLIEKLADLTLYVVRQKYTYKSQLGIVNDLKHAESVRNLQLIVNDVKPQENQANFWSKHV